MEARRSIEDACKRRLQKIRVKDVGGIKPLQNPFQEKNTNCKFHPLKLLLFFIVIGTFYMILSSPSVCQHNNADTVSRQHFMNRWIWGGSDPRYISDIDISWEEVSQVLEQLPDKNKVIENIGLLNFNKDEINEWKQVVPNANQTVLHLEYAEKNVTWDALYPEWIDEEQESEVPSCPTLPKLEVPRTRIDLIAVKLPCRNEGNWSRDVARLHLQLAAAGLASSAKGIHPVHLLFITKCFPIPNLYRCNELIARKGNAWLYKPDLSVLREKVQLPVGSCELALPFGTLGKIYSISSVVIICRICVNFIVFAYCHVLFVISRSFCFLSFFVISSLFCLWVFETSIPRKQTLYFYEVVVRSAYILPFPNRTFGIPLGMLFAFVEILSIDSAYVMVTEEVHSGNKRREAYATILHSAHVYVCGAIAAAQSIRMSGSTRDLVILVDNSISEYHRSGLEAAGWQVRTIQRIRNPKAEKDAYNEWNYSKFRLWQLTDYDKIIFIDADLLILRNIDILFKMPQISATGNNGTLFNSGVMVIEPSNCTFQLLMDHINEIESYNGGDQGYLNEIFTWWHRIPKHVNFLKNFWIGDDEVVKTKKTHLFGAEPPILYVLHYLGYKPWLCFRDYDCNWNVDFLQEFASDVAHDKWWKVHDAMPEQLQDFCLLRSKQKAQLEWDRRGAEKANYVDGHWKIKINDPRLKRCTDRLCNWKGMLKHWGEKNWTDDPFFHPSPPTIKTKKIKKTSSLTGI